MGSYSDAALALGPVSYFRLDDVGSALVDATGTLGNGTYTGSPTQGVAGAVDDGTAVTFSGSGQYAASPVSNALNNKSAYTISVFAKVRWVSVDLVHESLN